jgi:hypothetical protein
MLVYVPFHESHAVFLHSMPLLLYHYKPSMSICSMILHVVYYHLGIKNALMHFNS